MVRDLQLMKDITPLFEKKLVIWGMGQRGHAVLEEIISMGAGKKGILLCDSKCEVWGNIAGGQYRIFSPKELRDELAGVDLEQVVVLVPVISVKAQDEILNSIVTVYGNTLTVYTNYGIEWGIYLNIDNSYVSREYKDKKIAEREQKKKELENNQFRDNFMINQKERALKYFAFLPLHNDEITLVYQCGKVGSSSLEKSITSYGKYVLHCHNLADIGENSDDVYKIMKLKSGKIICMIRDPIAREISAMWENIHRSVYYHETNVSFLELEKACISSILAMNEFRWFDDQLRQVLKIDVFQHPFDKEKGYTIIKDGNMELLLIKLEKINELERIIGKFLDIDDFHLCNSNIGKEKAYRFAYKEYKERFHLSEEELDEVYKNDERIKHFYTELELCELYNKWLRERWA